MTPSSTLRLLASRFAFAALLGCAALARAQSPDDDAASEKPKQDQDYSMVVKRLEGTNNANTGDAKKVLSNADVYYRIHVFNASSAPANTTVNYTIFHKTTTQRNGNPETHLTNVDGTQNFTLDPHSDKILKTDAASARELKLYGHDNTIQGEVLGVYVEMIVDGKKVDSHESPDGIRAQMKQDTKDDQPGLAKGQN
jgi:hypothetical protein